MEPPAPPTAGADRGDLVAVGAQVLGGYPEPRAEQAEPRLVAVDLIASLWVGFQGRLDGRNPDSATDHTTKAP